MNTPMKNVLRIFFLLFKFESDLYFYSPMYHFFFTFSLCVNKAPKNSITFKAAFVLPTDGCICPLARLNLKSKETSVQRNNAYH